MQLSPAVAAAVQLVGLVAVGVALLRGHRVLRWLRLVLVGLAWVLLDQFVTPLLVAEVGPLTAVTVVSAVAVAGLLVSFLAANAEIRLGRSVLWPAVAAIALLSAALLVLDPITALGIVATAWVVGTVLLGWTFLRSARQRPGSLLEARLRLVAGAHWLLASVTLSLLDSPTWVFGSVPLVVGTVILVVAVAPPPALRLALSQTRQALRRFETLLTAIGPGNPGAVAEAVEGLRSVLGADAVLLVDDGEVLADVGSERAARAAREWSGDPATPVSTHGDVELVAGGRWVLAASTGRGSVVVALPAVGVLLSRQDRDQVEAVAERLGLILTREEARRADERATASMRAADRMRDDMLSTLSHELRTPLTSIMGFAEVLRSHADALGPQQVRDMLDRLVDRGLQLELIVSALLDLTAVRGRSEPDRIDVYELRDLARGAVLRRTERLAPRDVVVEGAAGVVHTDGGAVLAVVEELLGNAAKFTPPTASVRVVVDGDDDTVVVDVCDDGPGLGELGSTAFDPFVRGGEVLTREAGGVGIGLTIARELAHQLGGELALVPGDVGTTMRLTFPRRHDLAPRGVRRRPRAAADAVGDPTLVPSGRRGGVGEAIAAAGVRPDLAGRAEG